MKHQLASPAILSLGSDLFKLLEVYSWNDGSTKSFEVPIFEEPEIEESVPETTNEKLIFDVNELIPDNVLQSELAEMDSMGLPLSFNSSKVIKSAKKKKKKKIRHAKQTEYDDESASEVKIATYPKMSMVENDSDAVPVIRESEGLPDELTGTNIVLTEFSCTENDPQAQSLNLIPCKAKKTQRSRRKKSNHGEDQSQGFTRIEKYWCQRYSLFSRFDEGIKMDEEGWYSVTPEIIAKHHASMCVGESVVDCFAGAGGNAIQFAMMCRHVTAIDIDPNKIWCAHHNAKIYDVENQIDFLIGDFFSLASTLRADTVFLSPPWGGPEYLRVPTYDIMTMLKPVDGHSLFHVAKRIANKVIIFLPRNVDLVQLVSLSLSCDPPWSLQVEKNFLNGKFKAITAYFSMVPA